MQIEEVNDGFSDWEGLHRFLMENFEYMKGRIDPPSSLLKMGAEDLRAKSEGETPILALEDTKIIGCVFAQERSDSIYIGKLAVDPQRRGEGIARKLVNYCREVAMQCGVDRLSLETRVELRENYETFKKMGFAKCGESAHEGYDKPTSIYMECPLISN